VNVLVGLQYVVLTKQSILPPLVQTLWQNTIVLAHVNKCL